MARTYLLVVLIALTTTLSSGQNSIYSLGNKTQSIVINDREADDSAPSGRRTIFTPQIPKECEKLSICENIPNYPQEYVAALLAKLSDIKSRFNLEMLAPDTHGKLPIEEEALCKSESKIIYPHAVRTKNGKWVFVVNGKLKLQGYRVVLCINPNKPCSEIASFPPKYTSACKQQFIEELAWVLDDDGEMKPMNIPLPACCTCNVYPPAY